MSEKYTIGIDFGTLSGRAVLVGVSDGKEYAAAVMDYPHGVIDSALPTTGERLPADWALEEPQDYLDVLDSVIPGVIKQSGVKPADIIGVGIDFTCCTVMPVYSDGTPLCMTEKWKNDKNARCKLWKHHAAQKYADRINEIYKESGSDLLEHLGGKISSEWMLPKAWQILAEAPEIYRECDYLIEAGDWINMVLTGKLTRNYLMASFKSCYRYGIGYPAPDFLEKLDPELADIYTTKLAGPIVSLGQCAGRVSAAAARRFGLCEGTAVAAVAPDAHVGALSLGISEPGDVFGIFGTSNCYFLLSDTGENVPGICGCVRDGLIPGHYGYEAGLCCVGDHFAWVADTLTPYEYALEAKEKGISNLKLLIQKAAGKAPGQSGLIALDWWNGNRSILVDNDLSGLLLGMNLQTRPEDIMRALIEATAFGTRVIFENYTKRGIKIKRFIAAGGIPRKDPFTMQLYADVLHMPIGVTSTAQAPALGDAINAAAAAGSEAGGYATLDEAIAAMHVPCIAEYIPDPERGAIYDKLYEEYLALHDYFGKGGNDVMKRLRRLAENG